MKNILSDDLKYIFDKFKKNNYKIYLVGGCVRDALLNITAHDYDLTTDALPEKICQLFSEHKLKKDGINEGSITVIINEVEYEITTFRLETDYFDHRHPNKILFTNNLEDDLRRRDFTINALAYNPDSGITDLYSGMKDLKDGIIRTIGNCDIRFNEDSLRILRALRFASQLNFSIEKKTKYSIIKNVDLLSYLSKERITEEFLKIISSQYCINVLIEYRYIFGKLFSQINDIPTYIYSKLCQSLADCQDTNMRLAILFHNIQNIQKIHNLVLPKKNIKEINFLIENQYMIVPLEEIEMKKLLRDYSAISIKKLIEYQKHLKYIDSLNYSHCNDLIRKIESENKCYRINQLAVNGKDLLNLNISPSNIQKMLNNLLDAVIKNEIPNEKNALINHIKNVRN